MLFTPDCPHALRAEAMVREALEGDRSVSGVDRVAITDLDHAAAIGFHGSPTVRIDGVDIVPPDGLPISLACRIYRHPDGSVGGVPPESALRAAVDAWHAWQDAPRPSVLGALRELPGRGMRAGFLWASRRGSLERLATAVPLTRNLVERFVAGETLQEALADIERLHAAGFRSTLDVLGESVYSEAGAQAAADRYIEALGALAERGLDANVSLKLTQMGLDLDAEFCRRNVGRVVARAAESNAFVRVDMEDHTRTDRTLDIARSLHAEYEHVGVVVQSYLRRSAADVEALIGEGIRVRLCKGAYNEPATVAFPSKPEVDESFLRLMERLMREGNYPGIATHDERMIDHARDLAEREGIGRDQYEFQMLYGVRRDLQEALVADGYTVRVYVPYGDEWYPYFMRRLAERPANALFVLRSIARERRGRD